MSGRDEMKNHSRRSNAGASSESPANRFSNPSPLIAPRKE